MLCPKEKIQKVRDLQEQLCKMAVKKQNLQDSEVISLSKKIDRLLNEIDRLMLKER